MSCMRSARPAMPGGTPPDASGGDWLAPSQVNSLGMAPASVNAELVNCSGGAGGEDTVSLVEVVAVGLLDFSLEPPHAAPARQAATSTTASLRTGLVLVQEAGDGCRTFQGERGRIRDEHRRGG